MPKQVLPDEISFAQFRQAMECEGFRMITRPEWLNSLYRLGLQAPRKRKGHEVGFAFMANGLTVVVWTTYLLAEGYAREEDAGWVLIAEGDKAKYFSHPMSRTANFLNRLLAHALIAKERIVKRPLCPACMRYMIIASKGPKSKYWACPPDEERFSWDEFMSEGSKEILCAERRNRRRYRETRKKAGKTVGEAQRLRKPWGMARPQNQI